MRPNPCTSLVAAACLLVAASATAQPDADDAPWAPAYAVTIETHLLVVPKAFSANELAIPDTLDGLTPREVDRDAVLDAADEHPDATAVRFSRLTLLDRHQGMLLQAQQAATQDTVRGTLEVISNGLHCTVQPYASNDGNRVALSAELLTTFDGDDGLRPLHDDAWAEGWTGGRLQASLKPGTTTACLLPMGDEQVDAWLDASDAAPHDPAGNHRLVLLLTVDVQPFNPPEPVAPE